MTAAQRITLSLLVALVAIATGSYGRLRVSYHEGPYNREFRLLFVMALAVTLTMSLLVLRRTNLLKGHGLLGRATLSVLVGACAGYLSALLAYAGLICINSARWNLALLKGDASTWIQLLVIPLRGSALECGGIAALLCELLTRPRKPSE